MYAHAPQLGRPDQTRFDELQAEMTAICSGLCRRCTDPLDIRRQREGYCTACWPVIEQLRQTQAMWNDREVPAYQDT